MARVTVEDCVLQVPNRFELVLLAAQRSRDIAAGAPLAVDRDNDKNPVVSLREIAEVKVDFEVLNNAIVKGLQKTVEMDEPEEEIVEFLASEADMLRESVIGNEANDEALSVMNDDEESEGTLVDDSELGAPDIDIDGEVAEEE